MLTSSSGTKRVIHDPPAITTLAAVYKPLSVATVTVPVSSTFQVRTASPSLISAPCCFALLTWAWIHLSEARIPPGANTACWQKSSLEFQLASVLSFRAADLLSFKAITRVPHKMARLHQSLCDQSFTPCRVAHCRPNAHLVARRQLIPWESVVHLISRQHLVLQVVLLG